MRLKDIYKYSFEITKEDYIPTDGSLHIEDDDENIYLKISERINFGIVDIAEGHGGSGYALQLNEDVKNIKDGYPPFDYIPIMWVIQNGKVILEEANLAGLRVALGGSRYVHFGGEWTANRWIGGNRFGFYLLNEAIIKEYEFLNWINENPFEVKQ